jgi:hypothetical protein
MTEHLEDTAGKDMDAYTRAVEVIENSAIAEPYQWTNLPIREWKTSQIPPYVWL